MVHGMIFGQQDPGVDLAGLGRSLTGRTPGRQAGPAAPPNAPRGSPHGARFNNRFGNTGDPSGAKTSRRPARQKASSAYAVRVVRRNPAHHLLAVDRHHLATTISNGSPSRRPVKQRIAAAPVRGPPPRAVPHDLSSVLTTTRRPATPSTRTFHRDPRLPGARLHGPRALRPRPAASQTPL